MRSIILDNLHTAIGGTAINDNVLQVGVTLIKHRSYGRVKVFCLIEGWGNDTYLRIFHNCNRRDNVMDSDNS